LVSVPAPDVAHSLAGFLEPFGNRLAIAASAAEAAARASHEDYDALITGAEEADLLAAAPGVRAPIIAVLLRGDRAPAATDCLLRWPVTADTLFRAIEWVCAAPHAPDGLVELPAAIDAQAFSALEKSLGVKTLVEILHCYVATAEQLAAALAQVCEQGNWDEAQRLAHDIVGAAGALGLSAVMEAARHFAQLSRDGSDAAKLREAANCVAGEHRRAQKALVDLYPQLVTTA
ncbi:MAG: Hpt domain-containing protein, partial [Rhizomicrobium sp.]